MIHKSLTRTLIYDSIIVYTEPTTEAATTEQTTEKPEVTTGNWMNT